MSGIDLDEMRGRWKESNRQLDEQLGLDVEAMRRALAGRTRKAFRRHSRWLGFGLAMNAVVVVALLAFMIGERHDWRYLLMAAPLAFLALAELVVGLRQWSALKRLDLTASLLEVRAKLDVLRTRRLTMTKWIMLGSVLLWWPLLIVLLRGLTGFDLLRVLHPSVVTISVMVGLAFIPLALGVGVLLRRRFGGSPGYQRFLQEAAGRSWSKAEDEVSASLRFEQAVESGKVDELLMQPTGVPAAAAATLAGSKRATLAAIGFYATLMVLTVLFNLLHDGRTLYIVAGILLNLTWIPLMVTAILHRVALDKLDFGMDSERLRGILTGNVAMRASVARTVIALSPVLLLPIFGVAIHAITGIDVLTFFGSAGAIGVSLAAVSVSGLLFWAMRLACDTFLPGLVEAVLFGAPSRTANLLARIP